MGDVFLCLRSHVHVVGGSQDSTDTLAVWRRLEGGNDQLRRE